MVEAAVPAGCDSIPALAVADATLPGYGEGGWSEDSVTPGVTRIDRYLIDEPDTPELATQVQVVSAFSTTDAALPGLAKEVQEETTDAQTERPSFLASLTTELGQLTDASASESSTADKDAFIAHLGNLAAGNMTGTGVPGGPTPVSAQESQAAAAPLTPIPFDEA
jgi:hypothetical protein